MASSTPKSEKTSCITLATEDGRLPLVVEFHQMDGQIDGFPYGHLLSYRSERNDDKKSQGPIAPDKFSIWFATHDVVLVGWRLSKLANFLRYGRLMIVKAADKKFVVDSGVEPFVSGIVVMSAQKD